MPSSLLLYSPFRNWRNAFSVSPSPIARTVQFGRRGLRMKGLDLDMGYASNVGYGAIGAGIVFGVDIFIASDAFDFVHPYGAAVPVFVFLHKQDLVFIKAFHKLNRMTTEEKLRMMRICLP